MARQVLTEDNISYSLYSYGRAGADSGQHSNIPPRLALVTPYRSLQLLRRIVTSMLSLTSMSPFKPFRLTQVRSPSTHQKHLFAAPYPFISKLGTVGRVRVARTHSAQSR